MANENVEKVKATKQKVEQLVAYLKNNKEEKYPILNQMLDSATDYLRDGYFKMLAVVLQQGPMITDAQLYLFKRMIAGVETEHMAEDYLRMALEIEVEDFDKFSFDIKEMQLRYRFVLDAMILSCISEKDTSQIELVAAFAETLVLTKEEVSYLATMAKAILCLDTASYVDAGETKPEEIGEETFFGYIRLLADGCMLKGNEVMIFQPTCEEEVTVERLEYISQVKTPCVKLCNVKVNVKDCPLSFKNFEKVVLEDCEIVSGTQAVLFEKCEEVIIKNSVFKNFNVRTIIVRGDGKVIIDGTSFHNCIKHYYDYTGSWSALGGVIYAESRKNNPIKIDNCLFESCGGKNSSSSCRSAFICNYPSSVNNTRFINCWHYNSDTNKDPETEQRTMFPEGSKATNCKIDNSAAFC